MTDVTPSASLACNTVQTFLFARQDTTTTLAQWLCYEMYKNPEVAYRLRGEHDRIFGPGASSAADMLSQPGEAHRILAS